MVSSMSSMVGGGIIASPRGGRGRASAGVVASKNPEVSNLAVGELPVRLALLSTSGDFRRRKSDQCNSNP